MSRPRILVNRPRVYWSIVIVLILLSFIAGGLVYWAQERGFREQAEGLLTTIAQLKSGQIQLWREDLLADGQAILADSMRVGEMTTVLAGSGSEEVRSDTLKWMAAHCGIISCTDVLLVDAMGEVEMSAGRESAAGATFDSDLLQAAFVSRSPTLTDLLRNPEDGTVHIDLIVPITNGPESRAERRGALVESFDPHDFLFPLIRSWPVASASAESLLVERIGDQVVYLNELRHSGEPALSLTFPLAQAGLPAAMAVRGAQGVVEGTDYRGKPVLAALLPVESSPWFLVAKVDRSEALAPLHAMGLRIALMVLVFDLAITAMAGWIWRERESLFYQRRLDLELQRKAIERHVSSLARFANDVILLVAPDGQVVDANERAISTYGFSHDELLTRNIRDLRSASTRSQVPDDMRLVAESGGRVFETIHRRKDGSEFPVEVSSHVVELEGRKFLQSIVRDATERHRARDELEQLRRFQEGILQSVTEGITLLDSEGRIQFANKAAAAMLGMAEADLIGSHWSDVIPSDQHAIVEAADERRRNGQADRYELSLRRADGSRLPVQVSGSPRIAADGTLEGTLAVFSDISGRVEEEERLRVMSTHDPLTEVYNRLFFDEELARLDRGRVRPVSLIMLDLNGLKMLNDEQGHEAGDLLLRSLGYVLRSTFRQEDIVARLGGDEFAVILPGTSAEIAQRVLDRLRAAVRRHNLSSGSSPLDVAAGTATVETGEDLRQALARADRAMYADKARSRNL